MLNAKGVFHKNIQQALELGILYNHLSTMVTIPEQFDDLLRSQIVNAVSAFDRLMHDLIRVGMVKVFEKPETADRQVSERDRRHPTSSRAGGRHSSSAACSLRGNRPRKAR